MGDVFRTDLPLHVPLQEQLLCQDKPMLLNRKNVFICITHAVEKGIYNLKHNACPYNSYYYHTCSNVPIVSVFPEAIFNSGLIIRAGVEKRYKPGYWLADFVKGTKHTSKYFGT